MASPLLARRRRDGLLLDVQLRERDHVHIYHGLTRLVDASLVRSGLRVTAHASYRAQLCAAGLFRVWRLNESGFGEALDRYIASVVVDSGHLGREGGVQAAWTEVSDPWIPFDREAVLGYSSTDARTRARYSEPVQAAREEIERLPGLARWARLTVGKVGAELDQIAVDSAGRLVLLELKDARASAPSLYHAPLQLLQYVHEWAAAFDVVKPQLTLLIEERKRLGLSPIGVPNLKGGIRPALGFGTDHRTPEVRARLEAVRQIANRYLPTMASPIEVWAMRQGAPVRLA
jgi:hypothetical protein